MQRIKDAVPLAILFVVMFFAFLFLGSDVQETIIETTASTTQETTTEFTEEETEPPTECSVMVYITLHGTKYHYSEICARGQTISIPEETAWEIYEPCQKCVW